MGTVFREEVLTFINDIMEYYGDTQMDDSVLTAMLATIWLVMAISAGLQDFLSLFFFLQKFHEIFMLFFLSI